MSTLEQTLTKTRIPVTARQTTKESLPTRFLKVLCSVRFGVILLVLLGVACLIGMLIMQQNVDGFERYFQQITPAQRLVYGKLGLFDIYHAWYFNALLAALSLNIVLSSLDRFPKTWKYASRPNLTVPVRWLRDQKMTAELEADGTVDELSKTIADAMKRQGWKKPVVTERSGKTYVFAQSGTWNRFGAYAVHVGLLTIIAGGFLTSQFGATGQLPVSPGQTGNLMYETVVNLDQTNQITKKLPFDVAGVDIQQKLIKKDGSLSAMNTVDWMTRFTITDETGIHDAFVQMNRPFDYRGYRFFQASFIPIGRARNITINAVPADGGPAEQVSIARDGSATLADGTSIKFKEFRGNFRIGKEDTDEDTSSYPNPAAVLQVSRAGASGETAYAFGPAMADIPVAKKPVAGYTFELVDFEKVGDQHVLSVQRDPGAAVVYVGFLILFLTLIAVFFFSHQRVWAVMEPVNNDLHNIVLGGNTNRSANNFGEKFRRFYEDLATSRNTVGG